nr:uroporphyrinogen-III C-methyltransferase [uncultured Haemophilus sp.]
MSEKNVSDKQTEETLEQAVESSEQFAENLASAQNANVEKVVVKKGGTAMGLLALFVALAVGGAGYYFGSEKLAEVNAQIQGLAKVATSTEGTQAVDFSQEKAQLAELTSNYEKAQSRITQLEKEQTAYTSQILALQTQVEKNNNSQVDSSAWLLSDANFLLNSALRKLKIDTDVDTAQSLLEEADAALAKVTNAQLLPQVTAVRGAIQSDLNNLKNVNQVDQNALMQRLTALANNLDDLPMVDNETNEVAQTSGEVSDSIDDWQQNLEKTANSFLDHFIRVSDKNKNEDKGFIAPNQEVYLRENIRLRLQLAILAIPRQQNELYDKSLEAVGTWIRSYFDTKNENVKNFLKELDDLSEQSIYVDVPENLQSLTLLNNMLRKEPVKLDKIEIKEEKELVAPSAKEEATAPESKTEPKTEAVESSDKAAQQDAQAQ